MPGMWAFLLVLRSEVVTISTAPPVVALATLTAKAGFVHWVTGHNVHEEPVDTHVDTGQLGTHVDTGQHVGRAAARAALQKSASGDRAASSLSSWYQQLHGVIDA